jgi:hypothetical protein
MCKFPNTTKGLGFILCHIKGVQHKQNLEWAGLSTKFDFKKMFYFKKFPILWQKPWKVCPNFPMPNVSPQRGRMKHHWNNSKNKCEATTSNKFWTSLSRRRQKTTCTFWRKIKGIHRYKWGWEWLKGRH